MKQTSIVYVTPSARRWWASVLKGTPMVATATKKKSKKSPESKAADPPPPPAPKITTTEAALAKLEYVRIPTDDIVFDSEPNRLEEASDASIEELARSIAQVGLLQPVGVVRNGEEPPMYRLVFGRRRVRACRLLGWETIPALVAPVKSEDLILVLRGVENSQREEPTPADEALIVARLVDVYEAQAALGPTVEPAQGEQPNIPVPISRQVDARKVAVTKAAEYMGKSEAWIRDRMYLSRFGRAERDLVASGRLPLAHAREISKVADPEARLRLAQAAAADEPGKVAKGHWQHREYPMALEELRRLVSQQLFSLAQVPWALEIAFAGKPACVDCPHNSANNPGLFDGGVRISSNPEAARAISGTRITKEPAAGACTNAGCYQTKFALSRRAVRTTAGRVARAAKELPKAKRPGQFTAANLGSVEVEIPSFIPRAQVAAAANEAAKARKKPAGDKIEVERYKPPARDPAAEAREKLREARTKREKALSDMLAKAFAASPGAWSLFQLMLMHPLVRAIDGKYNWSKPCPNYKDLATPALRQLAACVAKPSMQTLAAMESGQKRMFALFSEVHNDENSGFSEWITRELLGPDFVDAELGPAPVLADYLPSAGTKAHDASAGHGPKDRARKPAAGPTPAKGKRKAFTLPDRPISQGGVGEEVDDAE